MADLVEILIAEHLTIKKAGNADYTGVGIGPLRDFHTYLLECHVVIEEKIVFPALKDHPWADGTDFSLKVERIAADHRLIDKLGTSLISWYESGDMEKFNLRLPSYFTVLVDHNGREEENIFGRWKELDTALAGNARKEAVNIIHDFGINRYSSITGIGLPALTYFLL